MEEAPQPSPSTTSSTPLPSISALQASSTPSDLTEMDSFFTFTIPSVTTSTEQEDFPVDFETSGNSGASYCVIA